MSLYDLIWQYKEIIVSVAGLCIVIAWYGLIVNVFYRMFKSIKINIQSNKKPTEEK